MASSSVLAELKTYLSQKEKEIRLYHEQGGSGRQVVEALSDLADQLLMRAIQSVDPVLAQEWGGALVAIGGYGRRELSPWSDIDLMFLFPEGHNQEAKSFSSELIRLLWDLGYKVGHSVRNVEECIALARQDSLIATSLLDARLLTGDRNLFHRYRGRFLSKVVEKDVKTFLTQLNAGREKGYQEYGSTPYLLEPNIKQSPGGLRDLHYLKWAALVRYQTGSLPHLHQWGLLSDRERATLSTAQDFLWRIRNQLHFHDGKASDHLTVELQEEMAPVFHYGHRRDLMRQYYILTGGVSEIARHFIQDAFPVSRWQRWGRRWRTRRLTPELELVGDEITMRIRNPYPFFSNDENVLRLFLLAQGHSARISGPIIELLHQLADQENKAKERPLSPESAVLFRLILSRPGGIARVLRVMHQTHVLWKIIPGFSHIHRLLQESRSHAYTVDEHTFRAVEEAEALKEDRGILGQVYAEIHRKDILHLALLLHDIGKGQEGDHCQIGANRAEAVAKQLGYTEDEQALLLFLVRRHLIFSEVALYRDFSNEPVLLQFAKEVAKPETLKKLFVLTCADIRAVGPGTWSGWKGELLFKLYEEALTILAGEVSDPEHKKVEEILAKLRQAVKGLYPQVWLDEVLPALTPRYLLLTPYEKIVADLAALFHILIDPIRIEGRYLSDSGMTEYTLYTMDQPGLFAKMTGVLAAKGLQIMSARVFTQANGMVVDAFCVIDPDYAGPVPIDRMADVARDTQNVLTAKETVEDLFRKGERYQQQKERRLPLPPVKIEIDNDSSHVFTIIDIFAGDRRGLLYVIAKTLLMLGLSVHSAKIATQLDQIVDVFYVLGPDHQKVTDPEKMRLVKEKIAERIEAFLTATPVQYP